MKLKNTTLVFILVVEAATTLSGLASLFGQNGVPLFEPLGCLLVPGYFLSVLLRLIDCAIDTVGQRLIILAVSLVLNATVAFPLGQGLSAIMGRWKLREIAIAFFVATVPLYFVTHVCLGLLSAGTPGLGQEGISGFFLAGMILNGLGVAAAIAGLFSRHAPKCTHLAPLMLNLAFPVIVMGYFTLGLLETISGVVCLFVYWLLIRVTVRLRLRARAWIVGGYALVHATSWFSMHCEAQQAFTSTVLETYGRAQAACAVRSQGKAEALPSREERDRNEVEVVHKGLPRWSFSSFAPTPCILISSQSYVIGPLWGLGTTCLYLLGLDGVWRALEEDRWMS